MPLQAGVGHAGGSQPGPQERGLENTEYFAYSWQLKSRKQACFPTQSEKDKIKRELRIVLGTSGSDVNVNREENADMFVQFLSNHSRTS